MADKRAYAKMDIGYLDNPKMLDVLEESHTAVLMHAASILYSAQHLTDGVVPVKLMQRKVGGSHGDVDLLSEVGLWHQQGHDCAECPDPPERSVVVHNYLEHNRSEAEANRLSKAGAKGAKARWANAPIESESDSGSHANRIADRNGHPNATENANPNGQRERKRDPSKEGGVGETNTPRRKPQTSLPEDLAIKDSHRAKAKKLNVDVEWQFQKFKNHHESKDSRFSDWSKAFHTWLTNAAEFSQSNGITPRPQSSFDPWASDWSEDDIRRQKNL